VRVRTALGEAAVDAPPAAQGRPPAGWQLGFRPEAARLGPGPVGTLSWRGRVESASFLGSEERVELEALGGRRLVLRLAACGARAGAALTGHLEPGKAWLFPA